VVNIIVEFSGPTESMTLTVIVTNEGDEAALQEQGIARAKDFALQFAAFPPITTVMLGSSTRRGRRLGVALPVALTAAHLTAPT
jgi:hypothetical protein